MAFSLRRGPVACLLCWGREIPHTWESDSLPGWLQGCWAGREARGVSTGGRLRTELTAGPGQERKEWGSEDGAGRGPEQEHPIKTPDGRSCPRQVTEVSEFTA